MKLRGALLGAGNIALNGHAPQWASDERLRREVEIVAVADLSPSNLQAACQVFPAARPYADAEELLDHEDLDFCDICTPPFTHRAIIERAAERGLHLVCEKPLAPTLEDATSIARAVREAQIVFQPCHQYHYSPQWQAVRRLLNRIGRVYLAEYDVRRTAANEGNPHWSPRWRTNPSLAGGGILVDHGAHIFYQLHGVMGEPKSVQATVRTLHHRGYQVEDTALVTLDYDEGLAHVSLTWAARQREISFRFVGEDGEIVGSDAGIRVHASTDEEISFSHGISQNSSHSDWYAPLLRDFSERVHSKDSDTKALDEAVYVTRLITRAYESSESGRAVPFAEGALQECDNEEVEYILRSMNSSNSDSETDLARLTDGVSAGASAARRRRGWLLRGAGFAALFGAALWTFHGVAWARLWQSIAAAKLGWIALAAVVNFGVLFFQAARWLALVRPMAPLAKISHAFKSMVVGFAVSTVVPARAGELARVQWFGGYTGLPRVSILGSILLDHLVNAAGLLAGLAVMLLFFDAPYWIRPGGWLVLALFAVGAMIVFAFRPPETTPLKPGAAESLPVKGLSGFLAKVRHGLTAVRDPRALGVSLGASLVAWTLEVNVTTFSMRAVGLDLPLSASFLVLLAVNLALALPFAPPGNMGTLEMGATVALRAFNVPTEQALAFGLCYHCLQVVPIALVGLFLAGSARGWRFGRRAR